MIQLHPRSPTSYDSYFFVLEEFETGTVRQHFLVNESYIDYLLIKTIAFEKAKRGAKVDIMPVLDRKDISRRTIYPDAKGYKNADLRINGSLFEVEQPTKPGKINNLKHRIDEGAAQANSIIINLIESISITYAKRVCKGRFIDHPDLKLIEFRYHGNYIAINRKDLL